MSMLPEGMFRFSAAIICEMAGMERLYASSLAGSQKTWISRLGAPATDTVPTPDTRPSGVAMRSSKSLSSALTLWSAVAAMIMMGMSSTLNLNRKGSDAPSGRRCDIMSNLSRTSLVASSMSVPYSNSSVRTEMFSRELEVMFFRSDTPLREFSNSLVRLFSTSSAEAPG